MFMYQKLEYYWSSFCSMCVKIVTLVFVAYSVPLYSNNVYFLKQKRMMQQFWKILAATHYTPGLSMKGQRRT